MHLSTPPPTTCQGKVNTQAIDTAASNINQLTHAHTHPEGHIVLCEAFSGSINVRIMSVGELGSPYVREECDVGSSSVCVCRSQLIFEHV